MTELDPVLQRAYSAARADRPRSGKGKAQTLAALGLASATADASSHAASTSLSLASRLPSWAWWTIGMAFLATSGAAFRTSDEPAPVPAVVSAPSGPGAVASADAPAPVLTVDQLPNAAEPEPATADVATNAAEIAKPAPPTNRRIARAARAPMVAASVASEGSELRDEIQAIERASRALSQRRCGLAREHLAAYEAKFPNGRLRREADVVAIEIAGRSGQTERARTAARRFVEQFPDTPYALRLAPWLREGAADAAGPAGAVMCLDAAE